MDRTSIAINDFAQLLRIDCFKLFRVLHKAVVSSKSKTLYEQALLKPQFTTLNSGEIVAGHLQINNQFLKPEFYSSTRIV